MNFRRSFLGFALAVIASLSVNGAAQAAVLVNFAEQTGSHITGTTNGVSSTITATDIKVDVTNTFVAAASPEYLTLSLTNVGGADPMTYAAGVFTQTFTGSFSIWSGPGGTGTELLGGSIPGMIISGSLTGAQTLTFSSNSAAFVSSYSLAGYILPGGLSLSLSNLHGNITSHTGTNSNHPTGYHTLNSFTATVTGTASANVPEPSSLALLGLGGIGMAIGAYRRRRAMAV